jgi:hypothetical protein
MFDVQRHICQLSGGSASTPYLLPLLSALLAPAADAAVAAKLVAGTSVTALAWPSFRLGMTFPRPLWAIMCCCGVLQHLGL